jgi:LysM repeat protein
MGTWTTPTRLALIAALAAIGCTDDTALEEAKQWYNPWFHEAVDNALTPTTEGELAEVAGGVVERTDIPAEPTLEPNSSLPYHDSNSGPDTRVVVIKVKQGETLGLYSKWSGIPSDELRALNEMKRRGFRAGKPFRLLLDSEGWRRFETARAEHFTAQEKAFFTRNEVTELGQYTVKKNDSLGQIAKSHGNIPVWLLRKFNASYNKKTLKVGAVLLIPKLENFAEGSEEAAEQLWANTTNGASSASHDSTSTANVATSPASRGALTKSALLQSTGLDIKVVRNETVGHYSRWSGLTLQSIRTANPTLNPDLIQAGQSIHLPMSDARIADFYQKRRQFHGPRTPKVDPTPTTTKTAATTKPVALPAPAQPLQKHRVASGETAWAIAVKRYKISLSKLQRANPGKNLDRLHEGDVLNIPATVKRPGGASTNRTP